MLQNIMLSNIMFTNITNELTLTSEDKKAIYLVITKEDYLNGF
ncbi:MAG: hypothetical protein ACOC08_06585 [Campylobacterales bacterium]